MTNIEIVTELLRSLPMISRIEYLEKIGELYGLNSDERKMAFWRAEDRSDEEIAKMKDELIRESETDLIMSYIANLSKENPAGNLALDNPLSNVLRISRLIQLRKNGISFQDAFVEEFGKETFESIVHPTHD